MGSCTVTRLLLHMTLYFLRCGNFSIISSRGGAGSKREPSLPSWCRWNPGLSQAGLAEWQRIAFGKVVGAAGSGILNHLQLHSKFNASLGQRTGGHVSKQANKNSKTTKVTKSSVSFIEYPILPACPPASADALS